MLLGGLAQVVEIADPELVVQATNRLRADARDPGQLDQGRRELLLQLRRRRDLAGLDEGDDLLLQGLPDPRQLGGAALRARSATETGLWRITRAASR